MFENKKVKVRDTLTEGEWYEVYISRLIASWHNAGGQRYDGAFAAWLKKLGLDGDTICDVRNIANNGKLELETDNGKLELETDVKKFIKSYNPNDYYIDFRESNIDEDIIERYDRWFERYYKIP